MSPFRQAIPCLLLAAFLTLLGVSAEGQTGGTDADLAIAYEFPADSIPVGLTLECRITVTNSGPDDAEGSVAEAEFDPAQWTVEDVTNPYGSASWRNGWLQTDLGSIPAGDSRTVLVSVTPLSLGELNLFVSAYGQYVFDPDESNNEIAATVACVPPEADLEPVVVVDPPAIVRVGEPFTFTLGIINHGPAYASLVQVDVDFSDPALARFEDAWFSDGGHVQFWPAGVTLSFFDVPVDPGDGSGMQVCEMTFTALAGGPLGFDGTVTGQLTDPDAGNNAAEASTFLVPDATDLSLAGFEVTADRLPVDEEIAFTLRLVNRGPLVASQTNLAITVAGTAPCDIDRIVCPTGGGVAVQVGAQSIVEFFDLPVDPGDGSTEQVVLLYLTPLDEGVLDLSAVVFCDLDDAEPGDELVEEEWICADATAVGFVAAPLRDLGAAPNPFNPRTAIRFELGQAAPVRIRVYDVRGRVVRTLLDGEALAAGAHRTEWEGRTDAGGEVPSGAYFYRIGAAGHEAQGRLQLVR